MMEHSKLIKFLAKLFTLKHKEHNKVKTNEPLQELNAIKKTIQLILKLQLEERDSKIEYLTGINKLLVKEQENIKLHLEQLEGATTTEAETPQMESQERTDFSFIK